MLGSGRPFIVEVSKPKKRSVDLKQIEQGMQQGMQQGAVQEARASVLELIQARFQAVPDFVAETVRRIEDTRLLRSLVVKAGTAESLDDFVRALPA
jgi:tRNA U54 and U55 pseudouridine synthase Pus10